jgi:hypothetical protein
VLVRVPRAIGAPRPRQRAAGSSCPPDERTRRRTWRPDGAASRNSRSSGPAAPRTPRRTWPNLGYRGCRRSSSRVPLYPASRPLSRPNSIGGFARPWIPDRGSRREERTHSARDLGGR